MWRMTLQHLIRACWVEALAVAASRSINADGETAGESERSWPAQTRPLESAAPPAKACGVIEIELSGARIRVEPGVELATLSTVLSALRGIC